MYDNNFYFNKVGIINDNNAVLIVSKCGCSSIAKLAMNYAGINVLTDKYAPFNYWIDFCDNIRKSVDDVIDNKIITSIIRDPKERFISSINSSYGLDSNYNCLNWNDYCDKCLMDIKEKDEIHINRHIVHQFSHYDYRIVDNYVWINDLDKCLESIGLPATKINATRNKEDNVEIPKEILKYYESDYSMIEKIKDKIWTPN